MKNTNGKTPTWESLDDVRRAVLLRLWKASLLAADVDLDITEMAEGIGSLQQLGAADGDLLWLKIKGLIRHGRHGLDNDGTERWFDFNNLVKANSYFVITDLGAALVAQAAPAQQTVVPKPQKNPSGSPVPHWDDQRSELTLGGKLVKQFQQPAPWQRRILQAFQASGWSKSILNPLPDAPPAVRHRTLHDAKCGLNSYQKEARIVFRGNGTGESVSWEIED